MKAVLINRLFNFEAGATEADDYDVGISLDSDVDEAGDTCVSSACTSSACESSLDKPVIQLRPMVAAPTLSCNDNNCFLPQ